MQIYSQWNLVCTEYKLLSLYHDSSNQVLCKNVRSEKGFELRKGSLACYWRLPWGGNSIRAKSTRLSHHRQALYDLIPHPSDLPGTQSILRTITPLAIMSCEIFQLLYSTKWINKFHNATEARVPAFLLAKLRESTEFRHVRPSVWFNSVPTERIFMNLGFLCPRVIIYSNKSTNQVHQSLRFIARRLNTAHHVSGILMPIIRSL